MPTGSALISKVGLFVTMQGLNLVVVNYDFEDGQPGHRTTYGVHSTVYNAVAHEVRQMVAAMTDLNRFGGQPEEFAAMKKKVLDRIREWAEMKDKNGRPCVLVELAPREPRIARTTQSDLAWRATHSGVGVFAPDRRQSREILPLVNDELRAEAERIERENAELAAIAARDDA